MFSRFCYYAGVSAREIGIPNVSVGVRAWKNTFGLRASGTSRIFFTGL